MKTLTNLKWLGSLMIVSQVVLTAFIGQWLFAQFNERREDLKKDLYRHFTDSKQEVMDSMIVTTLINPILGDKKGFKVHLEINNDSVEPLSLREEEDIRKIILPGKTTDIVTLPDTAKGHFDKMITLRHTHDLKNDLLLNGVKLIYREVASISNDSNGIDQEFFYKTDTMLFKKLLAYNLDKSGLSFNTHWRAADKKDSSDKKKSTIYFESNLFPTSYGVEISHYNFYLLKKMTPQFLFAFVLIMLTGIAFLFAYKSLKEQIRLSRMRNDFISNISHELKTPVSTVKVAIEALQNFDMKENPGVANEYLEMASLEMNRLDLLITRVLTTSMLEEGKQLISTEKTNINTLVEEVLDSMQVRFSHQQANVKFERTDENLFADIDRLHFQGVLMNLLDNSLKYATGKSEITVLLYEFENKMLLEVSDNGPGIPGEYIEKIFEKFFRIPTGNRHNVKGYGLGLSYALLIMQQHGGTIHVKNLPGVGCVFTLTLPKL